MLHDFTGMSREEWRRSWRPWLRGTAIGFPLGVLPCGGIGHPDVSVLRRREAAEHAARASSGTARSKAWPGPKPPTTPRRPACWCRC